jgi:AcrR family transcriptional regulator
MKRPRLLAREDLLPRPIQRRALERRARLKDAALSLFGERGYDRTSLGDVAERAGMAVGGIYLHFRSKRQLLLVLMDELLERLENLPLTPRPATDARAAIHEMLTDAFSADLEYLGACRAWSEAVRTDPELETLDLRIRVWTTSRVRGVFERLQRAPGARPGVDAAALARTMDVFFWNQLARAATIRPAELREWIESATHLLHHALFLDPPPPAHTPRRARAATRR